MLPQMPPNSQKIGKSFSGKYCVKLGHFVTFSYIYFWAKTSCLLLLLCWPKLYAQTPQMVWCTGLGTFLGEVWSGYYAQWNTWAYSSPKGPKYLIWTVWKVTFPFALHTSQDNDDNDDDKLMLWCNYRWTWSIDVRVARWCQQRRKYQTNKGIPQWGPGAKPH